MIIKIDEAKKTVIESDRVRAERDKLLAETDWRVAPDRPDAEVWVQYRQALRDIPQQAGFPFNVVWPSQPV